MTSLGEIQDPKPDRSRPGYSSYMATYSVGPKGFKMTELWVDRPYFTFWGNIKHKLVKVFSCPENGQKDTK